MFIYIVMTTLAVLGNAIMAYSYTDLSSNSTVSFSLWILTTSPNSGSTATRTWAWLSDYSALICSYNWSLFQAAEAWAIITTILCGIALLFNVLSIILQQQITIAKASIIGLVFSALIFITSWIAFAVIIANPYKSCNNVTASGLPSFQLGPAAFMYLGTAVFSAATLVCHFLTHKATKISRPEAKQPASPEKGYGYAAQTPVPVPASPNGASGTRVVVQPNQTPIRHELPLPEGNDWILDESGLYWSETKKLFFDRASGQFYDPSSDKWFNPEQNVWYKL